MLEPDAKPWRVTFPSSLCVFCVAPGAVGAPWGFSASRALGSFCWVWALRSGAGSAPSLLALPQLCPHLGPFLSCSVKPRIDHCIRAPGSFSAFLANGCVCLPLILSCGAH